MNGIIRHNTGSGELGPLAASALLHLLLIALVVLAAGGYKGMMSESVIYIDLTDGTPGVGIVNPSRAKPVAKADPVVVPKPEAESEQLAVPETVSITHYVPAPTVQAPAVDEQPDEIGTATGSSDNDTPGAEDGIRVSIITESIQKKVRYPLMAKRRGYEGRVLAGFRVDSSGMPDAIEVLESSGHGILDREVISTIRRASPYPAVKVRVKVPVVFKRID